MVVDKLTRHRSPLATIILSSTGILTGCTATPVRQSSPDAYFTYGYAELLGGCYPAARSAATKQAEKYCATMGKHMLIYRTANRMRAECEVTPSFRCLSRDYPALQPSTQESATPVSN